MSGAQCARAYLSDFCQKNVDGPVYRKILKKEAFPQFTGMNKFSKFWFQQDGPKAHTSKLTLDLVKTHFKKRVISNCFLLKKKDRLSYSPHLSPLDYFLWGYVKDRCYANRPTKILARQKNITDIFEKIGTWSHWLPGTSGGFWSELWKGRVDTSKMLWFKLSNKGTPIKFRSFYDF